jgi:hypothetical protein
MSRHTLFSNESGIESHCQVMSSTKNKAKDIDIEIAQDDIATDICGHTLFSNEPGIGSDDFVISPTDNEKNNLNLNYHRVH